MHRKKYIKNKDQDSLIRKLEARKDVKAERIKRLLNLSDLTEKDNSPVKILFNQIINLPLFKEFNLITFPKIVTVEQCFDLLNMPKDHPARKETDTYYLDENHILRTHTTAFWSFYLKDREVLEKLEKEGETKALAPGIVFRKDEVDKNHCPAFHQIDGLLICKKNKNTDV